MGKGLEDFDGVLPNRDLLFENRQLDTREQRQSVQINPIDRDVEPTALLDPREEFLADRVIRLP
jgi:hypothetical protein